MQNLSYLILMSISEILIVAVIKIIFNKKQKATQLRTIMCCLLSSLFVWTLSLIFQILFQNSSTPPIIFEKYAAFRCMFLASICPSFRNYIWKNKNKITLVSLSIIYNTCNNNIPYNHQWNTYYNV